MAMRLKITSKNATKNVAVIRKIKTNFSNLKVLHRRLGVKTLSLLKKQFQSKGEQFKTKWDELKPTTIMRRRKGPGAGTPKILRDTGILFNSFTNNFDNKGAKVGTATNYSEYHQFGTKIKGKQRVPIRKMLPENDKVIDTQIVKPVVNDFVKNNIKKHIR